MVDVTINSDAYIKKTYDITINSNAYIKRTYKAGSVPWFDNEWSKRFSVTIDRFKVANTAFFSDPVSYDNWAIYIDLSDSPSGFWSVVSTDVPDLRVTNDTHKIQLPREVVFANTSSDTGELHIGVDELNDDNDNLGTGQDSVYYIYYNSSSSEPEPDRDSPYGLENVWVLYAAVYHFQEDPSGSAPQILDSTSNRAHGTSGGSMTSGDLVQGALAGYALDFDGTDDYIDVPEVIQRSSTKRSLQFSAFFKSTGTQATADIYKLYDDNDNFMGVSNSSGDFQLDTKFDGITLSQTTISAGSWTFISGSYDLFSDPLNAGVNTNINGTTILLGNSGSPSGITSNNAIIGAEDRSGIQRFLKGQIDELRIRDIDYNPSYVYYNISYENTTNYNNFLDRANFYTLGSEETFSEIKSDVFIKVLDNTETINSDAFITVLDNTETLTSDAYILKITEENLTSDAHIFQTYSETLVSDVFIKVLDNTETLISDAVVLKNNITETLISDAYVKQSTSITIQSNTTILKPDITPASIISNAFIVIGREETITSDSFIVKAGTEFIDSDAYIKKLANEETITSDSFIKETKSTTILSNALINQTNVRELESDAYVISIDIVSSLISDAYILKSGNDITITSDSFILNSGNDKIILSDAYIKQTSSETINSDAFIKKLANEITINSDAFVIQTSVETLNSDAYIKKLANEVTISSNAYIKVLANEETIDSDAYILDVQTVTLNSDAYIKKRQDVTITSNATIYALGVPHTILSDVYVKVLANEETINSDSYILEVQTETLNSDAYVIFIETALITSDAYIKKLANEESIDSDAYILSPGSANEETLNSDAYILATTNQTIVSDAFVILSSIQETLNSDAYISGIAHLPSIAYIGDPPELREIFIFSDMYIKKIANEVTIASDAMIIDTIDVTITSDAWISRIEEETINSDAYILKITDQTLLSDASIFVPDNTETINSDAFIKVPGSINEETITSDSHILKVSSPTLISNAYIFVPGGTGGQGQETLDSDAYVKILSGTSLVSDAVITKVGTTLALTSDAYVIVSGGTGGAGEETINSDAVIEEIQEKTLTSDAYIKVLATEETINSNAYILILANEETINSNAYIYNTTTVTLNSDAYILVTGGTGGNQEETINSNAFILKITSQTIISNASILKLATNRLIRSDSHIVEAGQTSGITSDAWIKKVVDNTLTSDARIFNSTSQTIISDAYIREEVSNTITSDAYISGVAHLLSDATIFSPSVTNVIYSRAVIALPKGADIYAEAHDELFGNSEWEFKQEVTYRRYRFDNDNNSGDLDKDNYVDYEIYAHIQIEDVFQDITKSGYLQHGDATMFISREIKYRRSDIQNGDWKPLLGPTFRPQINDEVYEDGIWYRIDGFEPFYVGESEIYFACMLKRIDNLNGRGWS